MTIEGENDNGAEPAGATVGDLAVSDIPSELAPRTSPAQDRKKAGRWAVSSAIFVGVLCLSVVAGVFIRLPYTILSPGDATVVADIIEISGAKTFRHADALSFLTVKVTASRPSIFGLAKAWFDGDSEILKEEEVFGPSNRQDSARVNVQMMEDSELIAQKVALERVGYTVKISGSGVVVANVAKGLASEGVLEIGDAITAIDGDRVDTVQSLASIMARQKPGDSLSLAFERQGTSRTAEILAGRGEQGQALLGIEIRTRDPKVDMPVDIDIDVGAVSGPSAGLAFALTIVDFLTPGDITGGQSVAVTGTIEQDGHVGEIGGVEQKAIAARRAGTKIMIVPKAEAELARKSAGNMVVVGVNTLDDALRALEKRGGDKVAPVDELRRELP